MDLISHILWTYVFFSQTEAVLLAILFGILPDIIAFIPLTMYQLYKKEPWRAFHMGLLQQRWTLYPQKLRAFTVTVYAITHSIVIFSLVFVSTALFFGVQWWLLGWLLHIIIDIPTHKKTFFGTQIWYPFSTWAYKGIPWETRQVLVINATTLVLAYTTILVLF